MLSHYGDIKLKYIPYVSINKAKMSPVQEQRLIVNQQVVCVRPDMCLMTHVSRYRKKHSLEGIPRVTFEPFLAHTLAFDLLNGRKTIEEVRAIAYCIRLQD